MTTIRQGNALTGTLRILAPGQSALVKSKSVVGKAFNFDIPVGTYRISGSFSPPRGFTLSGSFAAGNNFSFNGLLPTASETGTYSLSVNGETDNGIFPVIGAPFPGPNPTAGPNPTTGPNATTGPNPTAGPNPGGPSIFDISFTPSSGSNFVGAPLVTSNFRLSSAVNIVGGSAKSDVKIGKTGIFFAFPPVEAKVGASIDLSKTSAITYIYNYDTAGKVRAFQAQSGTATLVTLTATSATIAFNKAVYAAGQGSNGTGNVTVSGTITGPLIR